jgi:hypothetical protein
MRRNAAACGLDFGQLGHRWTQSANMEAAVDGST